MSKTAIILAGGLGTRLKSVVSDVPKPMAPIGDIPFLAYQLLFLKENGIDKVILSVGYKKEVIKDYFSTTYQGISINYSEENEPLGTGGAILQALDLCHEPDTFILNGDTFFDIDLKKMILFNSHHKKSLIIATKKIFNNNRYGGIKVDNFLKITDFSEKDKQGEMYINGGIYLAETQKLKKDLKSLKKAKFSFEEDFLKKYFEKRSFYIVPYINNFFLDIGIPEDYQKGIDLISKMNFKKKIKIKNVFLDRDGVINNKIDNGYVLAINVFKFKIGFLPFIKLISSRVKNIVVLTNQRCVGKKLISSFDLDKIHDFMISQIRKKQGRISDVFYCPDINDDSPCRKPNTGMFLQAKEKYKGISFSAETLMIGDSLTDIIPAKSLNLTGVLIKKKSDKISFKEMEIADFVIYDFQEIKFLF